MWNWLAYLAGGWAILTIAHYVRAEGTYRRKLAEARRLAGAGEENSPTGGSEG